MKNIGHNSGGMVFETYRDAISEITELQTLKRYIQGLLADFEKMDLQLRGFYTTICLKMFDRMDGFPAEDRAGAMIFGRIDIRTYRRLMSQLIEMGILYKLPVGKISHAVFERELEEYVVQYRQTKQAEIDREHQKKEKIAEIAHAIEQGAQKLRSKVGVTSGKLRPNFGQTYIRPETKETKKPNEINGSGNTLSTQSTADEGAYTLLHDTVPHRFDVVSGNFSGKSKGINEVASDAECSALSPLARAYNNNNNTSLHFTSLKPKNTKHQHQQTSSINPARENFAAAAAADASCSFSEVQPKRDGIEEMLRSKNLTSKLIYEKLVEAGGSALSPLAIGLAQVSQPIAWLSQGCDFEADVLPTIRAVAKNFVSRNSGKISSWAYFHSAVMQARDLRLAVPKAGAATGGSGVPIKPPDTAPMAERVAYHIKHSYWARDLVYGRGRAKAEIEVADILAKTDKIRAEKQAKNAR